jgi:hypothetical protein
MEVVNTPPHSSNHFSLKMGSSITNPAHIHLSRMDLPKEN